MPDKVKEVVKDCFWVGAQNPDLRVFDIIMETEYGTSYNSYIVKGTEKTALFETAKDGFFDVFSERVQSVCDPKTIDYIIVNHTEPDHSGSLANILELCPNAVIVATATAIKFLADMVEVPFESIAVKDGMTLSLGDKTIEFIVAPNLHWPDTMLSYIRELHLLISCDFLGCHYSDDRLFHDLLDKDYIDAYAYYFDNIMGPFKPFVLKALDRIEALELDVIAPGHGPILRKDIQKYINLYREWATVTPNEKPYVVIAYVSAYGYTRRIAEEIAEGVKSAGDVEVTMFDLVYADSNEVLGQISAANGVLFGSPTIVGEALPNILSLLGYLNATVHKGKLAGAFGSYGWSGEAVMHIEQRLQQLKLKLPVPGLRIKFKPNKEKLALAFNFGKSFGEALFH